MVKFLELIGFIKDIISDETKMNKFREVVADIKELISDIKDVINSFKA